MAISGTAPSLVKDVFGIIFRYLPFHDQARITRVCRVWNRILYELQYEYGRVQALRALAFIKPLNLPVPIVGRCYVHGVKGTYILLSQDKDPFNNLWFIDSQTQVQREICKYPEPAIENLRSAQWIADDRFVTISHSPSYKFSDVTLWGISKKETEYQITSFACTRFSEIKMIKTVLPLKNRLFLDFTFKRKKI